MYVCVCGCVCSSMEAYIPERGSPGAAEVRGSSDSPQTLSQSTASTHPPGPSTLPPHTRPLHPPPHTHPPTPKQHVSQTLTGLRPILLAAWALTKAFINIPVHHQGWFDVNGVFIKHRDKRRWRGKKEDRRGHLQRCGVNTRAGASPQLIGSRHLSRGDLSLPSGDRQS